MTRIGVMTASVREGRKGEMVSRWVMEQAQGRVATYELIDLLDHLLPHFSEPFPPRAGRYQHSETLAWARLIASFDGFVFVTAEYNHGMPSALKNAIDHLFAEWGNKAAGMVGYGARGGSRAIDQLRTICGVVGLADVGPQLELSLFDDFGDKRVIDNEAHERTLASVFDAVEAWSDALAPLRRGE